MKLTLVTGNKGKLSEWHRLLPDSIELASEDIDLTEIQSIDPAEIVTDKARRAYEILKCPVVVEDVSAGLVSLGGLPGPFIKFFIKTLGENALYQLTKNQNEQAIVSCTIAYYDGKELIVTKGERSGVVVEARGENGFGFDKSFIPEGQSKTYGEMTYAEKDVISHRSLAIKALVESLNI